MTIEEIDSLSNVRPYCFETDREGEWYDIGLIDGLDTARENLRKLISEIWHDVSESPKDGSMIVIHSAECGTHVGSYYAPANCVYEQMEWSLSCFDKWCYLSSILPI